MNRPQQASFAFREIDRQSECRLGIFRLRFMAVAQDIGVEVEKLWLANMVRDSSAEALLPNLAAALRQAADDVERRAAQ